MNALWLTVRSLCQNFNRPFDRLRGLNRSTMKYTYRTQGTCSQAIEFEIEDGILKNVQFYGGCNGNTQGVATLVEGMKAEDVVAKLEGIRCGFKSTSCPDQLAKAIKMALES